MMMVYKITLYDISRMWSYQLGRRKIMILDISRNHCILSVFVINN